MPLIQTMNNQIRFSRYKSKLSLIVRSSIANADFLLNLKLLKLSKPVFIVGCSHTGTSIIHRILGYHTALFQIPKETNWFSNTSISYTKKSEILSTLRMQSLFHAEAWLEKTPNHVYSLSQIRSIFPNARFILTIRDPRDVVASLKARGLSLEKSAANWEKAYKDFSSHQTNENMKIIKLEDFLKNPSNIMDDTLDFLNLEKENLLQSHALVNKRFHSPIIRLPIDESNGPNHDQYRNWQINQPLFTSSTRWENDLLPEEIKYVSSLLSPLALSYGYKL